MTIYAMLNGNMVENIIVADDKTACEEALRCVLVEVTDGISVGPGWLYNPETRCFNPPVDQPIE